MCSSLDKIMSPATSFPQLLLVLCERLRPHRLVPMNLFSSCLSSNISVMFMGTAFDNIKRHASTANSLSSGSYNISAPASTVFPELGASMNLLNQHNS